MHGGAGGGEVSGSAGALSTAKEREFMVWIADFEVAIPLACVIPVTLSWRELMRSSAAKRSINYLPLVIASISLLWIAMAFANEDVLGPDYSSIRSCIILGNLIATLSCFLVSLVFSFFPLAKRRHASTALACLLLSLEWFVIGAVSSVA